MGDIPSPPGGFNRSYSRSGGSRGDSSSNSDYHQRQIDQLYGEKEEKYAEIERIKTNIAALKAEIYQKKGILHTMTGHGMETAYERLDEEIAGLVREKQAEHEAIATLKREIEGIKSDIQYHKNQR